MTAEVTVAAEAAPRTAAEADVLRPVTAQLECDSNFLAAQVRMHAWLLTTDTDQFLYNFREAAGLDTCGAAPMTGWDSPDGLLRGDTTGHYLSALAKCWRATGDTAIYDRARTMVDGLVACQRGLEAAGCAKGFLSAYDEEQFDKLEVYTPNPKIWAPYYTLHKILAGLLDLFELAGIEEALDELRGDVQALLEHHVHDARRHVQRVGLDDLAALDADAVARGGEARVVGLVDQGVAAVVVNGAIEKVTHLARHADGDVLSAGRVDRIDEADRSAARLLLVDRAKVPRHVARPMHERQHTAVEDDLEVALVVGMMDLRVPVELDAAGIDETRVEDLGCRARVGEAVHGIPFTWADGARGGPAPAACRRGGRCGRACSA